MPEGGTFHRKAVAQDINNTEITGKMVLTASMCCAIVKNAILWQDVPRYEFVSNIVQ